MRSHLAFRSADLVDVLPDDGLARGERLARLLAARLPEREFVVQHVDPEDWGWRVAVDNAAFPLWIGCGHYEEYADGHLCFIEPSRPNVRRWLRRIPVAEAVERLAAALEQIVRAIPGTYDVRWWTDTETTHR